jgi:hypothetical protein
VRHVAGRLQIVGTAIAVDGTEVTYRVESVEQDPEYVDWATVPPEAGDNLAVTYSGDDARFIHEGTRYRVWVWAQHGPPASGVHQAGECGGSGTRCADGSDIDTGYFARDGFEPWVAVAVGIPAAIIAAALIGIPWWLLANRRRNRRAAQIASTIEAGAEISLPGRDTGPIAPQAGEEGEEEREEVLVDAFGDRVRRVDHPRTAPRTSKRRQDGRSAIRRPFERWTAPPDESA